MLTLLVVYSDAWFWDWTGTTTMPPTVDREGSGSSEGSGEPSSENIAMARSEMIDEGQGIQKVVQTWDRTTEGLRLTTVEPTTQPESGGTSEKGTEGMSSHIRKPGNGKSSIKGMGSEGSGYLSFTGDVSGLGSGPGSELDSETGSGLWSDSGFMAESGFASGSGFETQGVSDENQQGIVTPTEQWALDRGDILESQTNEQTFKFQKSAGISPKSIHEGNHLGSTTSEPNLFSVEITNNTRGNSSSFNFNDLDMTMYSKENSTTKYLLNPIVGKHSVEPTEIPKDNQVVDIAQLPANQEALPTQVLQTRPFPLASQAPSTTQIPTHIQHIVITKPQTSKRPAFFPRAAQQPSQASAVSQNVVTSPNGHMLDPTQTSASEPSQAILISPTGGWAHAESHTEEAESALVVESPQCLLLDTALPFCSSMIGERFAVPNYLNQSSVEEVQVLLNKWAWLLKSPCHHSLEWFFCLLLVPKCGGEPMLPCRSFCEVLRDSCWTLLDEGQLPLECHTLPEEEDDGYQCLSVSNQKGNHWFR